MELRTLYYFITVAQKKSFTKAAAHLHISQPALSKQIQSLEEELSCTLLVRKPREVELTPQGALLLAQARKIIELSDQVVEQFKYMDEKLYGTIRIGMMDQTLPFFQPVLEQFMELYPGIKIELATLTEQSIHEHLLQDQLSFAFFLEPCQLDDVDFSLLPGSRNWGILGLASAFSDSHFVTFDELKTMRLAAPARLLLKNMFSGWIPSNQRALPIMITYEGSTSLISLVNSGNLQLLCLQPESIPENQVFLPLYPKLSSRCYISWKKYRLLSYIEQVFLDFFRKNEP